MDSLGNSEWSMTCVIKKHYIYICMYNCIICIIINQCIINMMLGGSGTTKHSIFKNRVFGRPGNLRTELCPHLGQIAIDPGLQVGFEFSV